MMIPFKEFVTALLYAFIIIAASILLGDFLIGNL